jgi:hypothetical protein
VLQIRTVFVRIRLLDSVVDPDWFNPDPAFLLNPDLTF